MGTPAPQLPLDSVADGKAFLTMRGDGILCVRWQPLSAIGVEDAHAVVDAVLIHLPSGNRRVLVEMTATTVSREAREIFCAAEGFAALAMIGASPVDEVIWAFAYNFLYPVSFFRSETDAFQWLNGYRQKQPETAS